MGALVRPAKDSREGRAEVPDLHGPSLRLLRLGNLVRPIQNALTFRMQFDDTISTTDWEGNEGTIQFAIVPATCGVTT